MGTPWAWPTIKDAPSEAYPHGLKADTHDTLPPTPADRSDTAQVAKEVLQTSGGIRLFFYERERDIAERAATSIEASYRYLAGEFAYAPRKTFAYFLYSSYIEFLQTQLFPIQEGVLGVTSPQSLELTLPYFGDARLFEEVSTHELAHEFTLQKLLTVAEEAGLPDAPLDAMPLWFIEGSAEYYAKRGMDPEAEMLVRDMIVNPQEDGYVLGSFWDDRMADGLWTYKFGQARCAFIEETYGKGTLQRLIEESPKLAMKPEQGGIPSFRALVAEVTRDRPTHIAARFERWIKRRAFKSYLETSQELDNMAVLAKTEGMVQTLATSPSGHLLMYRSIDRDTGTTSLYMLDRHSAADIKLVARDGEPGVETLHPVVGRNFDLTDGRLAFVAQSKGRDVIYVQDFADNSVAEPCAAKGPRASQVCRWSVDIKLGMRHRLEVGRKGMLTVDAIALSPDGRSLAFIGLGEDGRKDLFMIPDLSDELQIVPLTHDVYGERSVSWGPKGIVFNSDATGHGKYNTFFVDPKLPTKIERLTFEARDEMSPRMMSDGRVFFVAYDDAGANLYEVRQDTPTTPPVLIRQTDVPTGLFDVGNGPDGSVWALYHKGHRRTPVRIVPQAFLEQPVEAPIEDKPVSPPERLSLAVDRPYDAFSIKSWQPDGFFILAGFGAAGVYGSLIAVASDRLHDHGLILSSSVYGTWDLFDIDLTYINQERRMIWGAGIFHEVSALFDDTFEKSDSLQFVSFRRFFGGEGIVRWPFDQFTFVQADVALGGANYFVSSETAKALRTAGREPFETRCDLAAFDPPGVIPDRRTTLTPDCGHPTNGTINGGDLLTPWEAQNNGVRFHTETNVSFGYSTIGYHRATGPIRGSSLLLSDTLAVEPFDNVQYQQARLDTEHYFRIIGAANLLVRGALGVTVGDHRAPQFFLSSFHTLRGVPFGDTDYLLGRDFFYSTVEFQFPIATFIEFPLIDLEGVLAADFGGVGNGAVNIWDRRVLDFVFGFNLGFAPLVLRIHFGQPIGIGVPRPNNGNLVFNLSLIWRYQ
jgi:hypothetical protein